MTLKLKLIGMTAGMVLILALTNCLQFAQLLEKQKKVAVGTTQNYAAELARTIGAGFFERYQAVQVLASNEAFRQEKPDTAHLVSILNDYAKLYSTYDVILLTGSNGEYLASNSLSGSGLRLNQSGLRSQNYSNTPWFQNTLNGKFSENAKREYTGTYFEDAATDSIATTAYGEERAATGFSTQVKNRKGDVVGVLTARANMAWAEQEFSYFYNSLKHQGLDSAELTLLNKNGFVLVNHDSTRSASSIDREHSILRVNLADDKYFPATELVAGRSGSAIANHPRTNTEQAVGYVSTRSLPRFLDTTGWGIMVRLDEQQTYATVTAARNQFIWVSMIILPVFFILSYWFAISVGQKLAKLSENISLTSAQVMAGSEQMSSASQSLASTATEAASSLEETVSSIEELSAMVKLNANSALEAANLSRASRESADEGEMEIRKLVEAMNEINQSSKRIEDIINVIDDIAFQTNLLALNAAVEAARAGDQGRGFAVVAEEVRGLAQRSAAAAKDITSLIKENVSKIEAGVEVAGRGGKSLRGIVSSVRKVADLNGEIASASKEQSHGLEQISQAMFQLDQVTQTNAASAEEVASSAEEMSSQGLMLEETVSRLNALIHGGTPGRTLSHALKTRHTESSVGPRLAGPNVIPMRSKESPEKTIPFESDDNSGLGSTSGF